MVFHYKIDLAIQYCNWIVSNVKRYVIVYVDDIYDKINSLVTFFLND